MHKLNILLLLFPLLPDHGSRVPGYTLLAPRDSAFWRLFVQDATAPDPFLIDEDFREVEVSKELNRVRREERERHFRERDISEKERECIIK